MVHSCNVQNDVSPAFPAMVCDAAADTFATACTAGVIARTVSDVMLFNSLFSDCNDAYPEVELKGMRIGYPKNFWADLGDEVSAPPSEHSPVFADLLHVSALGPAEKDFRDRNTRMGRNELPFGWCVG